MVSKTSIGHTARPLYADHPLDEPDALRLAQAVEMSHRFQAQSPDRMLATVRSLSSTETRFLNTSCQFGHVGLLIFPSSVASGVDYLEDRGLAPGPLIRSVVVRERLARRYQLEPARCDLDVTRIKVPVDSFAEPRPMIEVFLFARDSSSSRRR